MIRAGPAPAFRIALSAPAALVDAGNRPMAGLPLAKRIRARLRSIPWLVGAAQWVRIAVS